MHRALSGLIDCPWVSSIDFYTPSPAAQTSSMFQSILLSLGQSINHDNALYINNYYIYSVVFSIDNAKTVEYSVLHIDSCTLASS